VSKKKVKAAELANKARGDGKSFGEIAQALLDAGVRDDELCPELRAAGWSWAEIAAALWAGDWDSWVVVERMRKAGARVESVLKAMLEIQGYGLGDFIADAEKAGWSDASLVAALALGLQDRVEACQGLLAAGWREGRIVDAASFVPYIEHEDIASALFRCGEDPSRVFRDGELDPLPVLYALLIEGSRSFSACDAVRIAEKAGVEDRIIAAALKKAGFLDVEKALSGFGWSADRVAQAVPVDQRRERLAPPDETDEADEKGERRRLIGST
jgi:hypothetical protein